IHRRPHPLLFPYTTLFRSDFAWTQAVKACEEKEKPFKVMIQPLVKGIEARMLVIEDKFNSAILRVPCHVIGNGEDNIQTLVDERSEEHTSELQSRFDLVCR